MRRLIGRAVPLCPTHARRAALAACVLLGSLWSGASSAGVLSESDFKQAESLKLLFGGLMKDLVETAKRPDISTGDAGCINSTIRELLQISDELASYEYLITMEKELTDVGDDSPVRGLVKFAVENSNVILASERKRLVDLSEQCARNPLGQGKAQQAVKVIDTTTGILTGIKSRL